VSALQVSVVLPTYNRADGLERAATSVLQQTAPPETYELIVVDNNSTDRTSRVLAELIARNGDRVRHVVETKQGVAFARNRGIDEARAAVVAFFDDDVRVTPEWIETIVREFAANPQLECIGGRVLPDWEEPPPSWLTPAHWAPLALQDLGDVPVTLSAEDQRGLISANLACRKSLFTRVGGFAPAFQRVKDGIGSIEDDEWMRRLWRSGGRARYVPELVAWTDVPVSRLTRAYHRRWHAGHGRFYAVLRAEEMERSSKGSLFGVPAHMYRSAVTSAVGWIAAACQRRSAAAFTHEVRLRFFRGFLVQRLAERRFP
jgi:glycosyltransferase involved in cell wall biosynthesis